MRLSAVRRYSRNQLLEVRNEVWLVIHCIDIGNKSVQITNKNTVGTHFFMKIKSLNYCLINGIPLYGPYLNWLVSNCYTDTYLHFSCYLDSTCTTDSIITIYLCSILALVESVTHVAGNAFCSVSERYLYAINPLTSKVSVLKGGVRCFAFWNFFFAS